MRSVDDELHVALLPFCPQSLAAIGRRVSRPCSQPRAVRAPGHAFIITPVSLAGILGREAPAKTDCVIRKCDMTSEIRVEHIGSMVRPARLMDARDAFAAGELDRAELTRIEDECILEALALQRGAGMQVLTDGELRRTAYTTDQYDAIEGFASEYPVVEQTRPDGTKLMVEMHTKPVVGKLRQVRRLAQHEASFLQQHAGGPYKITMPTPVRTPQQVQADIPTPYTTWDEIQQDILAIFRDEMVALAGEGVPYLQLDKVPLTYLNEQSRRTLKERGIDPDQSLAREIAYENSCYDAVRERHPDVILALHLCRGNRVGFGGGAGSYEAAAEMVFNQEHVDRFLLEYDTERAGGFEPLRFVPRGKVVMLGLVSTKTNQIEKKDDLLRRIEEASKYLPIEQLALGPQCGFQSAANRDGASMTIEDQRRKMEVIAETAREVWS
jgi:methionine synthase II (cobalamin-independent)